MRYASVFVTILIIWIAIVIIAAIANDTETSYRLYQLTTVFIIALFIFGFNRRK